MQQLHPAFAAPLERGTLVVTEIVAGRLLKDAEDLPEDIAGSDLRWKRAWEAICCCRSAGIAAISTT
jgi:hypothetical protein